MSEDMYLQARQVRVSKATLDKPTLASILATSAVNYGVGTYRGRTLPDHARRVSGRADEKANAEVGNASRSGQFARVPGSNVYVRQRRFSQGNQRAALRQIQSEHKGRKGNLYVDVRYPNLSGTAGEAMVASRGRNSLVQLRPGVLPTRRNRAKARYVAAHEHQHVRDLAGKGPAWRRVGDRAVREATAANPRQSLGREVLTGRAYRRNQDFERNVWSARGRLEGRADVAAQRRLGIDPRAFSGYPAFQQEGFKEAYREHGGPKRGVFYRNNRATRQAIRRAGDREYARKR